MGWLEKIIERSTRVITTTEKYQSYLCSFFVAFPDSKFCTIWNGYDEEDFTALEAVQPEEKFTMSYLGTFYYGRSPKSFLCALRLCQLMKQSNILLLFAPEQYYCIPAKAFEYLGSQKRQKPILCFSKDGATADLIITTGYGAIVAPDDIQQIRSAILRYYREYKQGPIAISTINTSPFERKTLTESLAI